MINVIHGHCQMIGREGEIVLDIFTVLEAVNRAVDNGDIDRMALIAMFEMEPKTLTSFTGLFIEDK